MRSHACSLPPILFTYCFFFQKKNRPNIGCPSQKCINFMKQAIPKQSLSTNVSIFLCYLSSSVFFPNPASHIIKLLPMSCPPAVSADWFLCAPTITAKQWHFLCLPWFLQIKCDWRPLGSIWPTAPWGQKLKMVTHSLQKWPDCEKAASDRWRTTVSGRFISQSHQLDLWRTRRQASLIRTNMRDGHFSFWVVSFSPWTLENRQK